MTGVPLTPALHVPAPEIPAFLGQHPDAADAPARDGGAGRGAAIPLSRASYGARERAAMWRATVAPVHVGPDRNLARFEERVAACTGGSAAIATSSGTAALSLALHTLGVGAGDEVIVPTLAPPAVIAPLRWLGAQPVLVDVAPGTITLDPLLVKQCIERGVARGRSPRAVIAVDLYGHPCDYSPLLAVCSRYNVPLIEDAADALGADWNGRLVGAFGTFGVVSFGAGKTATTAGGGALVSRSHAQMGEARRVLAALCRATAAHRAAPHTASLHGTRLHPMLAPLGLAQLERLDALVAARRDVRRRYATALADVPGLTVADDPRHGRASHWLSVVTVNATLYGATVAQLSAALRQAGIESRPVWTPLHLDPALAQVECAGGAEAERLGATALCLPSGAELSRREQQRIVEVLKRTGRK